MPEAGRLQISFRYPDEDKARRVVDDLTGLVLAVWRRRTQAP